MNKPKSIHGSWTDGSPPNNGDSTINNVTHDSDHDGCYTDMGKRFSVNAMPLFCAGPIRDTSGDESSKSCGGMGSPLG